MKNAPTHYIPDAVWWILTDLSCGLNAIACHSSFYGTWDEVHEFIDASAGDFQIQDMSATEEKAVARVAVLNSEQNPYLLTNQQYFMTNHDPQYFIVRRRGPSRVAYKTVHTSYSKILADVAADPNLEIMGAHYTAEAACHAVSLLRHKNSPPSPSELRAFDTQLRLQNPGVDVLWEDGLCCLVRWPVDETGNRIIRHMEPCDYYAPEGQIVYPRIIE